MAKTESAADVKALVNENDQLRRTLGKRDREIAQMAGDRDNARAAKDKLRNEVTRLTDELSDMKDELDNARRIIDLQSAKLEKLAKSG